jgi:hypothetical protein
MVFDNVKNVIQRKGLVKLLLSVIAGTQGPQQYQLLTEEQANKLKAADGSLIEINPEIKVDGKIAVRATDAGIKAGDEAKAIANTPKPPAEKLEFKLETGFAIPEIRRGGATGEAYPFDQMEAGQSFFVPATESRPFPAKSLASTVSSATRRYAIQDGTTKNDKGVDVPKFKNTRVFAIRSVEENGKKGARIWRTS